MKTAVVTDVKYRSAIPVVRALGRAEYEVIAVQSAPEITFAPPAFFSKYVKSTHIIDSSVKSDKYAQDLLDFLLNFDNPLLFCTGADTLRAVSSNLKKFEKYARFTVSSIDVLDALNDKERVHERAQELGIPVPRQYDGVPDKFPVVIKPHCGEKYGLKAGDRYAIAYDREQFSIFYDKMKKYDEHPIVQQKVDGDGFGACLLIDKDGQLANAYCHRRIREYPVSGGPSACCESIYDEKKIENAYKLLRSFDFSGMAMVEYKGEYLLEVNPRVWGSFPLSECINSSFTQDYARVSEGEKKDYVSCAYSKVRMHFMLNDALSILGYIKKGKFKIAIAGVKDMFFAKEALYSKDDKKPFFKYLKSNITGR